MNEAQYLKNLEEEKTLRIDTARSEREAYLADLKEDGEETISSFFTETYKRYYKTFTMQYNGELFKHMDEIQDFHNLHSQYWRMVAAFSWNDLRQEQKKSLFERFPSMQEYLWIHETNINDFFVAPEIHYDFLPKAVAVAIVGMISDRFDPEKQEYKNMLDDRMWLEYNIDMRDWDKVYRDIDGWGVISSKPSVGLIPDIHMEVSGGYFEELLRDNIALDDEIKRRIIDYYETYSLEQIESLISIMEHERGEFFLLSMDEQATTVRELVEKKQHEWEEILSYYGRSES